MAYILAYHGIKILDFHVHFPPVIDDDIEGFKDGFDEDRKKDHAIVEYSKKLRKRWRAEWDFPEPEEEKYEGKVQAERWVKELEKHDIKKVVFVTGHGDNQNLARWIKPYKDKFIGFAYHDPQREDAKEQLVYAIETLGFKGYKMFAPLIDIPLDDESLDPIWDYCAKKKLPVLIHFGVLGGGGGIAQHKNISPISLFNVAKNYTDIPFVIPHFGACFWGDLLRLAWACPNVYVDTSGSNQWIDWMPYPLTLEDLFKKTYETIGPSRIIFGSDSSWFPRGFARRYLQDQMRICHQLNFDSKDIKKIFGQNAARLLKINF